MTGTPTRCAAGHSEICAVLFDMDGTIIGNAYPFAQAKSEILLLLSRSGVRVPDNLYGSIANLLVELGKLGERGERLREEILEILSRYDEESTKNVRLRRGVVKLLRWLRLHGYGIGLVSNSNIRVVSRILKQKRIRGLFDVVITREYVEKMKPYPDMVILACRKLRVEPSRTLVVGDSWVDVEAGLRAGAKTVYLNFRRLEKELEPTYLADSLEGVIEILRLDGKGGPL